MLKIVNLLFFLLFIHGCIPAIADDTMSKATTLTETMLKTSGSSRQSNTVPYQPYVHGFSNQGLLLVHIKINDTISGNFLLDTGSNFSVLSDELADRIQTKKQSLVSQGKLVLYEGKPVSGIVLDKVEIGGSDFAKYMFVGVTQLLPA